MRKRPETLIVPGLLIILGLLYLVVPSFKEGVNEAVRLLASGDIVRLKEYLLSFGVWAPVVSGLLMVLQSIAAPLPAFVITFANGLLFGAFWGALLSWSSAMVGAIICYYIARSLGRPVVERIVGKRSLAMADRFFERYGRYAVLIARLIPVVSFDVVSYAAGVTSIGPVEFLVATGIGQAPATVLYSILGQNIGSAELGLWIFGAVISLLVLGWAVKSRVEKRLSPKEA